MNTKYWGPKAWDFLFTSVLGAYPENIVNGNKEHLKTKKSFRLMLTGLQDTMPCIFCRNSFKIFIKELPIDSFLKSRKDLCYWLYLMKEKVNKKLLGQETKVYVEEKAKLKHKLIKSGEFSDKLYESLKRDLKKKIICTVKSPPFEKVLEHYEKNRAGCSLKTLSCSRTVAQNKNT